jgi:RNA polymerase sigma-70 factor, ECF subfamily
MTEQDAIARLKRGDISGLDTLIEKYQTQAVRTAYLITRERASAEDVVQSTFLQTYDRIDQFDVRRPFGPWFLRCVINNAIKSTSRTKRTVHLDGDTVLGTLLTQIDTEQKDIHDAVWDALGALPADQRAVIVLRYYLEFSEAEIAQELVCPPGTVKSRLHTARKRLKALLRPLFIPTTSE